MYEEKARRVIDRLYVSRTLKGYAYCIYAIALLSQNPDYACAITKCVYPAIARKYQTTWTCVERNLRTFIEIIWRDAKGEGASEFFDECLGGKAEKRPSNCKFLNAMMRYLERMPEAEHPGDQPDDSGKDGPEETLEYLEKKIIMVREENNRLAEENRHLAEENRQLSEEVARLRTHKAVGSK